MRFKARSDVQGRPQRIIGVCRDVTEQRSAGKSGAFSLGARPEIGFELQRGSEWKVMNIK
jgi:hypothetical protein